MKLKLAPNSLFAVLLRKPWWLSLGIAVAMAAVAFALLPPAYRVVGALSGFPLLVISAMAAWRQRHQPNARQVEQATQALRQLAWPAFSRLLEQAFERDGYTVGRGRGDTVDFKLERQGQQLLVSARKWKSARIGLEPLRGLQTAREAADGAHAMCICLGNLSDTARPFAARHGITIWQAPELAQAMRGLLPAAAGSRGF